MTDNTDAQTMTVYFTNEDGEVMNVLEYQLNHDDAKKPITPKEGDQ